MTRFLGSLPLDKERHRVSHEQSPHCTEHYASACYSSEINRLGARLTEVEAALRKLRRIARVSYIEEQKEKF
jgi:hypothetical protein